MEGSPKPQHEPGRVARGLAVLLVFYFVEGLPFGFQAMALPVLLRREGVAASVITAAGVLALPWLLKVFWAPFVDSRFSTRLGRRRSWILPMQLAMAVICGLAAALAPAGALPAFLGAILAMNLCAAVMDIAVDGLAIELLAERHLGYGNAVQVAGYKVGMLVGGGAMLVVASERGASAALLAMGTLALVGAVVAFGFEEPESSRAERVVPPRIGEVVSLLWSSLRTPAALAVIVFIGTYKAGEAMADALFRVFLVDAGFTDAQIARWVTTYGTLASLLGSVCGGALASRARTIVRAVGVAAFLRALALGAELHAVASPSEGAIIMATLAQHFFGGALTTAMFAFMMSMVDRRIGATHYTLLATVEALGKGIAAWPSGLLQERIGYVPVYTLAVALSLVFLGLLRPIARLTRPDEALGESTR